LESQNHIPHTAIVLLSYNSLALLKKFVPLIKESVRPEMNCQFWIVDNASTDETDVWVKENHPDIFLFKIKVNNGFTGGYTESLHHIKAKNYVLISSDIQVSGNWLTEGIKLLDSDSQIAAVQPKIKSFDEPTKFEYAGAAGGYIDYLGYPFCKGRLINSIEVDEGQYDVIQEIFWASGACLFIKADLYHQSGGLENAFFAHMEEIDLCWRLKNMGYKIMYQPNAEVFHMGGFIIQYGSPQKIYRNHRNNLIMLIKNLDFHELIWKLPFRFILDYAAFLKMLLDGNPKAAFAVCKAHRDVVWYFPAWYKKRKTVQKLFVSNKNTFGIYDKSILFQFFLNKKKTFSQLCWKP